MKLLVLLNAGDNLLNLYAPSEGIIKQRDVFHLIRGLGSSPYPILAGDFHCVLSAKDTERNFGDKKCPALQDLVSGFNLSDAFRVVKPDVSEFTFHRPNCAASRLDRFYIPQEFVPHIQQVSHHASLGDHHYVVFVVDLPDLEVLPAPPKSSPLYWKLNTSILDEDFLEIFETVYQKVKLKISEYHYMLPGGIFWPSPPSGSFVWMFQKDFLL